MSKTIGGSDPEDAWARCPTSLEATPESFADPTDANDPPDPSGVPTEVRDAEGAPRSFTADTLVQRAMTADSDADVVDEYVTFGFDCRRPDE